MMLRSRVTIVSLTATSLLAGCRPPAPESIRDLTLAEDGTVYIASNKGRIMSSTNQGGTWVENASFSSSVSEIAVSPDGTLWAVHTKPKEGSAALIYSTAVEVSASCDLDGTFELLPLPRESFAWEPRFVPRASAHPFVLLENLFAASPATGCPTTLIELGKPLPAESIESAVVCGSRIYLASATRIFSSNDEGQSWSAEWDFAGNGEVRLACEYDKVWAIHLRTGDVMKQDEPEGDFVEVGSFDGYYSCALPRLRFGYLVVAGLDCGVSIRSMTANGTIQVYESPKIDDYDEYLVDFEISSDGVFWLVTNRGVYRDDANEVWSKVWP